MAFAQFVTDFGDQALLLPLAFGVLLVFVLAGWPRGALAWTFGIGGMLGLMLVLKLHFLSCTQVLPDTMVRTPSGHTAASAAIYGGLLAIGAGFITGHLRWTVPLAVGLAVIIGTSRVVIGAHNLAEVLVGGVVGVCSAVAMARLAGPPPPGLRMRDVVALSVVIIALLHGLRAPAEAHIRLLSRDFIPFACF